MSIQSIQSPACAGPTLTRLPSTSCPDPALPSPPADTFRASRPSWNPLKRVGATIYNFLGPTATQRAIAGAAVGAVVGAGAAYASYPVVLPCFAALFGSTGAVTMGALYGSDVIADRLPMAHDSRLGAVIGGTGAAIGAIAVSAGLIAASTLPGVGGVVSTLGGAFTGAIFACMTVDPKTRQ